MPADTIYRDLPCAHDAFVEVLAVVNQTPEQARAQWNGTAGDAIDRRLMAIESGWFGVGRRATDRPTEPAFDPDDERR